MPDLSDTSLAANLKRPALLSLSSSVSFRPKIMVWCHRQCALMWPPMPRSLLGGDEKYRTKWRAIHQRCFKQQCDTDAETEKQESGQKRNADTQKGSGDCVASLVAAPDKRARRDEGKWECINCAPFLQRTAANPVPSDDPAAFDPDAVGDGQCQFRTPVNTNCRVEFTVECSVCHAVCCTLLHGRAVEPSPPPPPLYKCTVCRELLDTKPAHKCAACEAPLCDKADCIDPCVGCEKAVCRGCMSSHSCFREL
jgi:hypothetical protein